VRRRTKGISITWCELLPFSTGPGAQKNFGHEHPPRDGGTSPVRRRTKGISITWCELLPLSTGPGAQKNFGHEHPPRDGGTSPVRRRTKGISITWCELLPLSTGPGAQKNFGHEHPPRDGGTSRAAAVRSVYKSCLIQFVFGCLYTRATYSHPPANPLTPDLIAGSLGQSFPARCTDYDRCSTACKLSA
jgi:hypothetical protein